MNIIQVPLKNDETRPAFDEIDPNLQNFYPGQRVLTAYDFENPNETSIYFKKKHDPGEPRWPDGGFECVDISGGFRAFYLDAVVIHPSQIKQSQYQVKGSGKRGRPKRNVINLDGSEIEPVVKTGKRGRPKKYADGESPSALAKLSKEQDTTVKKGRGRPPKDPNDIKTKVEYIPNGGKRGRPRMYEPGQSPSELKKKAEAEQRLLNTDVTDRPKRGRPKKIN